MCFDCLGPYSSELLLTWGDKASVTLKDHHPTLTHTTIKKKKLGHTHTGPREKPLSTSQGERTQETRFWPHILWLPPPPHTHTSTEACHSRLVTKHINKPVCHSKPDVGYPTDSASAFLLVWDSHWATWGLTAKTHVFAATLFLWKAILSLQGWNGKIRWSDWWSYEWPYWVWWAQNSDTASYSQAKGFPVQSYLY